MRGKTVKSGEEEKQLQVLAGNDFKSILLHLPEWREPDFKTGAFNRSAIPPLRILAEASALSPRAGYFVQMAVTNRPSALGISPLIFSPAWRVRSQRNASRVKR